MKPVDLSNRQLGAIVAAAAFIPVAYFLARPALPDLWRHAGTPVLYLTAVTGAVLLLASVALALAKRARARAPRRLMAAHVGTASFGMALIIVHSTGTVDRIPVVLIVLLFALAGLGIWARTRLAMDMSATFGRKSAGFAAADPAVTGQLRTLIDDKAAILARLNPQAAEATYSVTLADFLRRPAAAAAYWRLARREEAIVGARQSVRAGQAWWRPLHIALAALFVAGLVVHILTVTFFAGYVAAGREIYWWHLTAW